MTERGSVADDDAFKFGLLLEGAHTQQRLAEMQLQKLVAHTEALDEVVREAIRRTLIDELQALRAECDRAACAVRGVERAAQLRARLWTVGIALACTIVPGAISSFALPSSADIAALRAQRDTLAQSVARLEQRGGKVDWRACGAAARLCVRIDRNAPAYGGQGDYYVLKGY
jgi:adenine deaminase